MAYTDVMTFVILLVGFVGEESVGWFGCYLIGLALML
jgi:hypothetical protein